MDYTTINRYTVIYGVISVITLIMFITTAALFITSKPVPDSLSDTDKYLMFFWIGLLSPTPGEVFNLPIKG